MSLTRTYARKRVTRDTLAGTIEQYHEQVVVPHLRAQDRAMLILGLGFAMLAATVVWLLVRHVG